MWEERQNNSVLASPALFDFGYQEAAQVFAQASTSLPFNTCYHTQLCFSGGTDY
jgi:hypothetical protein